MKPYTRIIAAFVAVVITFSSYAAPQAEASLVDDVIYSYTQSSIAQWTMNTALATVGTIVYGPIGGLAGQALAAGINDLASWYAAGHTDEEILVAEQGYVASLPVSVVSFADVGFSPVFNYTATEIEESYTGKDDFEVLEFNSNPFKVVLYCLSSYISYKTYYGSTYAVLDSSFTFYSAPFSVASSGSYRVDFGSVAANVAGDADNYFYPYLEVSTDGGATWTTAVSRNDKGSNASKESISNFVYWRTCDFGSLTQSLSSKSLYRFAVCWHRAAYASDQSSSPGFDGAEFSASFTRPITVTRIDEGLTIPESSTRIAPFLQTVNNNTSNTYNYYLVPAGSVPTADTVISPAVYDEETLVFTEPVTGAQYQTTGWTYDYTTRTYDIALEAGTFTIGESDVTQIVSTYGDDAATITYYDAAGTELASDEYSYVIAGTEDPGTDSGGSGGDSGNGGEDTGTGDHKHSYTDQITKEPGCTLPGVRTYTCECGDSYTKTVPATGHDWAIGTQVNASYDPETGELLQPGYVIYSCSTCGQQYKDDSNTGPPSSGSSGSSGEDSLFGKLGELLGTAGSGVLDLISTAIGKLLDGAIALLEMAFEKLGRVVEILLSLFDAVPQLFGGYLDMFGAVFAFIPEDIITLLTFGVACVIILGVWKMIRR